MIRAKNKPVKKFAVENLGYTLLEIIVVLFVAGFIAGAGMMLSAAGANTLQDGTRDSGLVDELNLVGRRLMRDIMRSEKIITSRGSYGDVVELKVRKSLGETEWRKYSTYSGGKELGFQRERNKFGEEVIYTRRDSLLNRVVEFNFSIYLDEENGHYIIEAAIFRQGQGEEVYKWQERHIWPGGYLNM